MDYNISLKPFHTFGLDVKAAQYVEISTTDALQQLTPLTQPFLILGGGSNMLFTKDFEGLVLHNQIKGIQILEESATEVLVEVGGGEVWHEFVLWSLQQNYGGIENLSLIPGSVGAAPIQNIGAYGVELKDVFHNLEAIHVETGVARTFTALDCQFGYRDSIFKQALKGQYFITKVVLRLSKEHQLNVSYGAIQKVLEASNAPLSIQSISNAVIQIRQQKLPDPKEIGNSGSFFKNPIIPKSKCALLKAKHPNMPTYPVNEQEVKLAAGWLIDQLGWKGYRQGDAGVHKNQALVLVNYNQAQGQEIWALAQKIQTSVLEAYDIVLEPEVNVF